MKIVVFAPHPDDEIIRCGGSILKWIEEGNDVHIVYVTDNRKLISWGRKENQLIEDAAKEFINLSEDEIGLIGLREAEQVAKEFGFPRENVHMFKFYDQDAINQINKGIELSKNIIKDSDRVVLPSDNNQHPDHQATHNMVKRAAQQLNLKDIEFYVYALHTRYKVPKEKQIRIKIANYREKLYDLLKIYKTQLALKDTRDALDSLKYYRFERFGMFRIEDVNKFYNF